MEKITKLKLFERLFSSKRKSENIEKTNQVIASFTFQPTQNIKPNTPIQFINNSKNAEDFVWDFGDGTISTDPEPLHTFLEAGEYKVKLLALSEKDSDSSKLNIVVEMQECYSV